MSFLVEDLIESVKDRSFVPISQSTFEDEDILRILNEELSLNLLSDIIGVREDFFLARKTYSIQANEDRYLVPTRASGNAVKAVFYVDPSGNYFPMSRIDVDRLGDFSPDGNSPRRFYFEGDEVVIVPRPTSATGSILIVYFRKPNRLALTSSCAKITNVSTLSGTTTFTVNTDLTGSLSVGSTIDFLRAKSPFALWASDVSITAITTTTIAVALSSVADVDGSTVEPEVNDYICPATYANIPMVPEEFHPVLAEMGAVRILRSMGDLQKWQASKSELEQMRAMALKLIRQRAESAPDMFTKRNPLLSAFRGRR